MECVDQALQASFVDPNRRTDTVADSESELSSVCSDETTWCCRRSGGDVANLVSGDPTVRDQARVV